ncbi:MAG: hypothetical protein ACXVSL_12780 [Solirubrobacteraceae bacterium]
MQFQRTCGGPLAVERRLVDGECGGSPGPLRAEPGGVGIMDVVGGIDPSEHKICRPPAAKRPVDSDAR